MMNLLKLVSSSSVILGVSFVLRFLLTLTLAKYLSASELGIYSWVVAALGFATIITNFGLDFFLIRKIPEYRNSVNGMIGSVLKHTQRQSSKNAFLVILVIFPLSYFSTYYFEEASQYNSELMIILLALPFISFSLIFSTALRTFNFSLSSQMIESILQTGTLLFFILLSFGVFVHLIPGGLRTELLVSFFVFSWIISCFCSYQVFRRKVKIPKLIEAKEKDKSEWRKDQTSIVIGILGGSFLGRSDIFLLAFLVSPAEVGAYFICLRLAETLLFFCTVSYYVWGGEISNLIQEGRLDQAQSILKKSSQLCVSITFAMACFGFIFAEEILLLVSERYAESAFLFKIALCVFFIKGASGLMRPLFYILGEQQLLAKLQWIIGLSFTALVFITVPIYGVVGCLVSFAICEILFFIILVTRLYKKHNLSLSPI